MTLFKGLLIYGLPPLKGEHKFGVLIRVIIYAFEMSNNKHNVKKKIQNV